MFSNPQVLCAGSFAKGAYAVSHGFSVGYFFDLSFALGSLEKELPVGLRIDKLTDKSMKQEITKYFFPAFLT